MVAIFLILFLGICFCGVRSTPCSPTLWPDGVWGKFERRRKTCVSASNKMCGLFMSLLDSFVPSFHSFNTFALEKVDACLSAWVYKY